MESVEVEANDRAFKLAVGVDWERMGGGAILEASDCLRTFVWRRSSDALE